MRNNKTVCSTLNGLLAIKHPTLNILVRADYGARATENKKEYYKNYHKAHIDEIHARQRKYHQEHREEINARKRRRAHEQANH